MKNIIIIVIIGILTISIISVLDSCNITTYNNVKIIDKEQQQIIKGSKDNLSTNIRYLIITDKGTFICESNILQGKFNNSDIYYHIKKDSIYSEIKVSGYGKGFIFDYQNIISIK